MLGIHIPTGISPRDLSKNKGNLFQGWKTCRTIIYGVRGNGFYRGDSGLLELNGIELFCGSISHWIGSIKFKGDLDRLIVAKHLVKIGRSSVNPLFYSDRTIGSLSCRSSKRILRGPNSEL